MDKFSKDTYKRTKKIIQFSIDKDDKVYVINHRQSYKFGKTELVVPTPNIAGIFLNLSEKEAALARNIYAKTLQPILRKSGITEFDEQLAGCFYEYIEHIQTAVITLYTAIESIVNSLIPDDYLYHEEKNNGNLLMDKPFIERNKTTDFKFSVIIPDALKVASPKKSKHWSNFKKLENIRNSIIHLKADALTEYSQDKNLIFNLLKPSIFKILKSTQALLVEIAENCHDSFDMPALTNKEHTLKLIFQDWELCEEYFQYKGIFPRQSEDNTLAEPSSVEERITKSYSRIYRIK